MKSKINLPIFELAIVIALITIVISINILIPEIKYLSIREHSTKPVTEMTHEEKEFLNQLRRQDEETQIASQIRPQNEE